MAYEEIKHGDYPILKFVVTKVGFVHLNAMWGQDRPKVTAVKLEGMFVCPGVHLRVGLGRLEGKSQGCPAGCDTDIY